LATRRQLEQIVQSLYESDAPQPLGIYLHGSLAMGCFHPARSDLDLLVVTAERAKLAALRTWADLLLRLSMHPHPVEISMLLAAPLQPWQHPYPFAFHYSEAWRSRMAEDMASEAWRNWGEQPRYDPDLAAHLTVLHRRGIRLAGMPAAGLLPEPAWTDYLAAILEDFDWAKVNVDGDPVYLVLNACRVWAAQTEGLVLSKAEGAQWALLQLPLALRATVVAAAAHYGGQPATTTTPQMVAEFTQWIETKVK
jgi:predicted nucleotidyltransferase